jgi:pimeloyl-ACP methyl ester carboxylesterase
VPSTFTAAHRGGGAGPPLVCLHGFTDTWRTWEPVLPRLERAHDVLAPTLLGHAGGPPIGGGGELTVDSLADAVEDAMDAAGFATAHLVGNSLGGYVALQLAARGRAASVVALAPAGGWAADDAAFRDNLLGHFVTMQQQVAAAMPHADALLATDKGRRRATQLITTNYEHLPAELLAHQMGGVVGCDVVPLVELAQRDGYPLAAEAIACPVRIVWGTDDRLLPWPSAATRFRDNLLPHADWVELDGIGHCPQLDVPLETAQLILGFTGG